MKLGPIHIGDLVVADVGGRRFYAQVTERATDGEIGVAPIEQWPTWRRLTARQVVGHFRPTKATVARGEHRIPPRR